MRPATSQPSPITVNGQNVPPQAFDVSVTTSEDGPTITELFNVTDVDSTMLTFTIVTDLGPGQGSVTTQGTHVHL